MTASSRFGEFELDRSCFELRHKGARLVGKPELLINRSCPRMAERKPSIHFSPAIPARNNRPFDWFVIGEKEKPRSPAEDPPLHRVIVRN